MHSDSADIVADQFASPVRAGADLQSGYLPLLKIRSEAMNEVVAALRLSETTAGSLRRADAQTQRRYKRERATIRPGRATATGLVRAIAQQPVTRLGVRSGGAIRRLVRSRSPSRARVVGPGECPDNLCPAKDGSECDGNS